MKDCPFCTPKKFPIFAESIYLYAILDEYPVNAGHVLIIPKRHVQSFFNLTEKEANDIFYLLKKCKIKLAKQGITPDGFNIGVNVGYYAGQSVFHTHIHLIPRYKGDVENPRGGVRGVIPNKQNY
jgi:diadenosine tetraphosphate (Ap4A) HIT family hydrolase